MILVLSTQFTIIFAMILFFEVNNSKKRVKVRTRNYIKARRKGEI